MPVYVFRCSECGAEFDQKLAFSHADDPVVCPNGHLNTRRIFTSPTVVFKGSGFYVTDHPHNGRSSSRQSD